MLPEEIERIQSNGGFVAMGRVNGGIILVIIIFFCKQFLLYREHLVIML
jgi:hypothetical protein